MGKDPKNDLFHSSDKQTTKFTSLVPSTSKIAEDDWERGCQVHHPDHPEGIPEGLIHGEAYFRNITVFVLCLLRGLIRQNFAFCITHSHEVPTVVDVCTEQNGEAFKTCLCLGSDYLYTVYR